MLSNLQKNNSYYFKSVTIRLLIVILFIDMAFIMLHVLKEITPFIDKNLFSLTADNALPEMYQYIKFCIITVIFLIVYSKSKVFGFLWWALLFFYLLVDDSFSTHEVFGEYISQRLSFSYSLGLRPQDFGELTVTALFVTPLLCAIAYHNYYGKQQFRMISFDITFLIIGLAFFGVGIDMLGIVVKLGSKVDFLLSMIEEGGEMIFVSLTCWYLLVLNAYNIQKSTSLFLDFGSHIKSKSLFASK